MKNSNIYKNQLKGYKLQFNGRLNGKRRKSKFIQQSGQMPASTINKNIYQNSQLVKIPSGICTIKISFYYKENSIVSEYLENKDQLKYFNNLLTYKIPKYLITRKYLEKIWEIKQMYPIIHKKLYLNIYNQLYKNKYKIYNNNKLILKQNQNIYKTLDYNIINNNIYLINNFKKIFLLNNFFQLKKQNSSFKKYVISKKNKI